MTSFLERVFSIKNNGLHKVVTLCGLKIKLKNNKNQIKKLFKEFEIKLEQEAEKSLKRIRKITPFSTIETIEIHIVEHCNLQCKGCVHFAPLANEEFLSIEEFKDDLIRMYELTNGNIKIFNILGGEPLLHPECLEFLKVTREIFPNSNVKLVTNGILLPEQTDAFFEACANYDITIEPTKYQLDIDWEFIEKKCKQYNVKLEYFQQSGFVVKTLYKDVLDIEGKHNEKEEFLNCRLDDYSWMFLDHGKIYKCARTAYIRHFSNYFNINLDLCENDYVDIYKINSVKEILDFFARPSSFCKHCAHEKKIGGFEWSKSEKNIYEWVDDSDKPQTLVAVERERERERERETLLIVFNKINRNTMAA